MRALAAALLLVLAAPLGAEGLPAWRPVDDAAVQSRDIATREALVRDFPDSVTVRLLLLNAQTVAGDATGAIESLAWIAARGHVFSQRHYRQLPERLGDDPIGEARAEEGDA
ncbi:MAG: hypothetical protein ACKO1O_02290 [Erythrobacter sp.]